jgi:hypothetical protein
MIVGIGSFSFIESLSTSSMTPIIWISGASLNAIFETKASPPFRVGTTFKANRINGSDRGEMN